MIKTVKSSFLSRNPYLLSATIISFSLLISQYLHKGDSWRVVLNLIGFLVFVLLLIFDFRMKKSNTKHHNNS